MHTSHYPKSGSHAPLRVLRVDGSGRYDGSDSRALSDDLIAALQAHHGDIEVTVRDMVARERIHYAAWRITDPRSGAQAA